MNHNPTNQPESKINKLTNANNADLHNMKVSKIIGDYKPGYIYGTVKMHKPGYPLRLIISHCRGYCKMCRKYKIKFGGSTCNFPNKTKNKT